jgi:hypothetical protein
MKFFQDSTFDFADDVRPARLIERGFEPTQPMPRPAPPKQMTVGERIRDWRHRKLESMLLWMLLFSLACLFAIEANDDSEE